MAERRALLRQRLAGLVGNSKRLVTGQSDRPAGDVTLAAPLVQQHFWCLDQLAPGQGIVNVNRAWRIDGAFDPERCRSALSKLTHKYDSLRYGLRLEGDSLQITVKDQQAVDFDQIDLRQSPEALDGKLEAESLLPFDVEAEPLLRLRAYHLAEQAWVLHLVYHHAIMDGWSLGQFCQELGTVYAAPDQQVTRPTYDFAAYAGDLGSNAAPGFARRAALRLTQRPKDRRQKPVDMPDLLLPYDFARPPVARFQGESSVIEIKSGSRALVEQLAGRLHVSPIAVLLAVLRVTLFRITGQRDFCIGNTAMNRNAPGLQKMLGAFVETLPIHTPLVPEMGFDLLCQAEQQALAKALEQDETGEEAGPETGEAAQGQPPRAPRDGHEVVLNYRGFSTRDLSLPGCQVQPLPLSGRSTPFTLALNLENTDAGYRGELVWNKARFCAETADRMVAEFTAVLAAALDSPGTELAALPPQSSATEPVLQTAAPKACPPVVTQLLQSFADHADQDAVSQGDQRWSYRDLDQASAAWAATIAQAPGDPGDLVALALPRGPEFVAALIAILRSGRAFLPLSPADPAERLKRILNSANPRHLIAAPELADSLDLQALERPGQGTVEGPMQGSDAPIGTDAVFVAEPEDLAYVMFTSGSTGAPKGVEIPHRALSHHLAGVSEVFEAKSGDRLLSLSSTTFDSIIFEVLLPLVTGGSLVMVEEARRKDPWHIVAQLRSVQPDLVFATPSMWRMLLEAEPPLLPRLTAVTGGELLSRDLANRILPQVGRLVNGYGPTEATVFSSWCDVRSEEGAEGGCSQIGAPIGLPFPGYKVAVLDADYQAVWPGRLGEIWISGAGLARGYYQAPERSAEVFVDMDAKPGPLTGRWYRSGDLGRLLPGGGLGYAGRADEQLKISGQRVEPGEIENLLLASGMASAAAVFAAPIGETQVLIACYVAKSTTGQAAGEADLRQYLRDNLPSAWVPSLVLRCEALPLNASGKLDRAALTERAIEALQQADQVSDTVQGVLAPAVQEGWHQVLGRPPQGGDQDFFAAGGSSLLLIKFLAHIREKTGCHLPVAEAFGAPTPLGLSALLAGIRPVDLHDGLICTKSAGEMPPLVFLPGFVATGPNLSDLLQQLPQEQGSYLLQRPVAPASVARRSFADHARYYAKLLQHSAFTEGLHLTGFSYGGAEAFETARHLAALEMPPLSLTVIDNGPVFRRLTGFDPGWATESRQAEVRRRAHELVPLQGDMALIRGERPGLISFAMLAYGWEDFVSGEVAVHLVPADHRSILHAQAKMTAAALQPGAPPHALVSPLPGASDRRRVSRFLATGEHEKAFDLICAVSRAYPHHPWSVLIADRLAQSMQRDIYDLLQDWMKSAPQRPPEAVPALAWYAARAEVLRQLQAPEAALAELDIARQATRDSGAARDLSCGGMIRDLELHYGDLLQQLGRVEEAIEVLERAGQRCGYKPEIWRLLGICLAKVEKFQSALPILKAVGQTYPQDAELQTWLRRTQKAIGTAA